MAETPETQDAKPPRAPSFLAKIRAFFQHKPAPAGKQGPSLIESTATVFKAVRDIVISLVVLIAVGFCGVILWNDVRHPHPVIEPIDIPKSVADGGGTTNGFADRIRARIASLRAEAAGQTEARVPFRRREATTSPLLWKLDGTQGSDLVRPYLGELYTVPDSQNELLDRDGERKALVIPDTGLSLDAISDYAKDMFGYRTMLFSGEIVEVDGCDAPVTAAGKAPARRRKVKASDTSPDAAAKAYVLVMQERVDGRLTSGCASGREAVNQLVDDAAIDVLEETDPTLAQIVLFKDNRRRAIRLANRVIESHDYSAEEKARSHNLLGTAAVDDRDYPAAVAHFRNAVQLDGVGYLYIYDRNLCEAMGREGKVKLGDALAPCKDALKTQVGTSQTYVTMANVYALYGDYENAVSNYQAALAAKDPDTPLADPQKVKATLADAQREWGLMLNASGDKKKALEEFRAAAATYPTVDAFLTLGNQQADFGDRKDAAASYRSAAALAPGDGHAQVLVAMEFFIHGAPADAENYFRQAFAKDAAGAERAVGEQIDSLAVVSQYKVAEVVLTTIQKAAPDDKALKSWLKSVRLLEKKHPEPKAG